MQSFACSYYLKRPDLLQPVAAGLVAGAAHRQLARSLGCAPSTVTRLAARIGRHAMLLQALALEQLSTICEPIVLDHFETFVYSQDDRLGLATPVGQRSWFVYGLDPAAHRRGGRRSRGRPCLKRRLPAREPGPVARSTERVLRLLLERSTRDVEVVSDDAPAYGQAVRALDRGPAIRRRVFANPPRGPGSDPAVARERDRQMFAVDLLHKIWRHTQAHHRRETLAFGRRSNAVLERGFLFVVWRNFVKRVSERRARAPTPAMRLGLLERPLGWASVFSRRLFPARIGLPEGWETIYRRGRITPAAGRNLAHDRVHAF